MHEEVCTEGIWTIYANNEQARHFAELIYANNEQARNFVELIYANNEQVRISQIRMWGLLGCGRGR